MPLAGLTLRRFLQPFVREAVKQGFGANEIQNLMIETIGSAYRRADLLLDIRTYREALRFSDPIKALKRAQRVPRDLMSPTNLIRAPFNYKLKVTTRDTATGKLTIRSVDLYSTRELTRGQVEDRMTENWQLFYREANEETLFSELEEVYYNPERV